MSGLYLPSYVRKDFNWCWWHAWAFSASLYPRLGHLFNGWILRIALFGLSACLSACLDGLRKEGQERIPVLLLYGIIYTTCNVFFFISLIGGWMDRQICCLVGWEERKKERDR